MKVAVAGGTGTLGRRVLSALAQEGHEARSLSRSSSAFPVDLTTGAGLETALAGCEVVIDASNGPSSGAARGVLVDGTRRLLEFGARAGVAHHICVSIVGIDKVPMAYYRVKLEQEAAVESGSVPWTIVRATQFHDLVAALLSAAGRRHVLPGARARLQPVEVGEVAGAVAALAVGPPRRSHVTVAGPQILELRALGRIWREATGTRAVEIPLPLPGRIGRALREGALTCAAPDVQGTGSFAAWLQAAPG